MRDPKPPRKPPVDPWEVFKHALRFHLAITRLDEARRQDPAFYDDALIPPMLVWVAFEAELMFKAQLLVETGTLVRGHNLRALFDKLKPDSQNVVEAEWNKVMAANEEDTKRLDAQAGERLPRDLREALDVSGRSFEQLRYMYERDDHRAYISLLPHALKSALLLLNPDWKAR